MWGKWGGGGRFRAPLGAGVGGQLNRQKALLWDPPRRVMSGDGDGALALSRWFACVRSFG